MYGTRHDTLAFKYCPVPANGEYAVMFDSTRGILEPGLPQAAPHIPGTKRWQYRGLRGRGTVKPIGDEVTVILELLTEPDLPGTAASFEVDVNADSSGQIIIPAGTTTEISWLPGPPDYRMLVFSSGAGTITDIHVAFQFDADPHPGV